MADNTTLNVGSGGDVIASDDIGGVKHQRVKLSLGPDGTAADAPTGGGTEAGTLRVTIASDSTGLISIDDNGGSITVDGSVTATGGAAHDAAVSGSPNLLGLYASAAAPSDVSADGDAVRAWGLRNGAQVIQPSFAGVLASAGNGASGTGVQRVTLANDSTGVIASISTSITPGTAAANLGKAEDAAHTTGDVGVMMLAVRRDSAASSSGTDGDYSTLNTDSTGNLRVNVSGGAISGVVEDAVAADGVEGVAVMAVRRDSASSGVSADGDYAMLSVTSDGSLRVAGSSGTTQYTEDAASAGAESLVLCGTIRQDSLSSSTSTDGDYAAMKTNSAGRVYVTATVDAALPAGTNNIGDVDVLTLPALPAGSNNIGDVDVLTLPNVTLAAGTNTNEVVGDVAQDAAVAGNPVLIGARASTATPTAMSADGDAVYPWATREGALVVTGPIVDDAAFTPGTSRVNVMAGQADETATDSVDEGDAGAVRITLDRKLITTPYAHAGAGGATAYKNLDCDESEDDIKTSAGKLFWIHVMNLHASATRYIKFYNATAANVTVGTTTPVLSFAIPANTNGFCINFGDMGVQFDTAISVAATTGLADNDTGAPGANEVVLNAGYI